MKDLTVISQVCYSLFIKNFTANCGIQPPTYATNNRSALIFPILMFIENMRRFELMNDYDDLDYIEALHLHGRVGLL